MLKKMFLLTVFFIAVVCFSFSSAFAGISDPFEVIVTDDCSDPNNVNDVYNFIEGDTSPYLFLDFPDSTWMYELTMWYSPDATTLPDYYCTPLFNASATDHWCSSFDDIDFYSSADSTIYNWSDIEALGEWRIGATFSDGISCTPSTTTFNIITPEPATSALFLIGGTAIAMIRRRKNKKSKGEIDVI
ncbi:MAG: PEP-CTERM sorting domain-containing protein [Candidatus Omnitrophica bacterium]|nr:PEP-CTERM sorting domain-containing protein [Candidatus Omnitrophota bacterium]